MAQTQIRGLQIEDGTIERRDLNTATTGHAVITKIVQGANVTLSSTGADSGTGDVTISVPGGGAGPPGTAGLNAFNITSGSFTVPPVGSTVTVTLNDASWVVVGQMLWIDQSGGGVGQAGEMLVTAKIGNQVTLQNVSGTANIPSADSTQKGLLNQLSGATTDFVDGTNTCQNLVTAVQPTIWYARLRSFNAVGNPNFEVDQRNCYTSVNPASVPFTCDRWAVYAAGTMAVSAQSNSGNSVVIPGTNFRISRNYLQVQIVTSQASLGAGDYLVVQQQAEGPQWRELSLDIHSLSVLIFSNNAITFSISIRDPATTKVSFVQSYALPANVWTLVPFPNLPLWTAINNNFSSSPGNPGYLLCLVFAAGSGFLTPNAGVWQSGNYLGVTGMSNMAALAPGAKVQIAFIQHEPGPVCTTLMDQPFSGPNSNLEACQRYYAKSYDYGIKAGATSAGGPCAFTGPNAWGAAYGSVRFPRTMAKVPTVIIYDTINGAANGANDGSNAHYTSVTATPSMLGNSGFAGIGITPVLPGAGMPIIFHYTADTNW